MVTRVTIFSSKCTKKRLAAGLRPDPLGELKRSPRLPSLNKGVLLLRGGRDREGRGKGRREGKERGERKEVGRRERERRGGEERTVPIVSVLRKHTGMVPIMGPIQRLCTRALSELATPLFQVK